jgi:hypothetical protein
MKTNELYGLLLIAIPAILIIIGLLLYVTWQSFTTPSYSTLYSPPHRIINTHIIDDDIDNYNLIRLYMYQSSGFTEQYLNDKSWQIRRNAYRALGYKNYKQATQDDHWQIRLEAYQCLGFTQVSLEDENEDIKNESRKYFNIKNKLESLTSEDLKYGK